MDLRWLYSAKLEKEYAIRACFLSKGLSLDYDLFALILILLKILHAFQELLSFSTLLDRDEGEPAKPRDFGCLIINTIGLVVLGLIAIQHYFFSGVHGNHLEAVAICGVLDRHLATLLGMNCKA